MVLKKMEGRQHLQSERSKGVERSSRIVSQITEGRVIESFQLTESNEVHIMEDYHDNDSYGDL